MRTQMGPDLARDLASPEFAEVCMTAFNGLDKNNDGKLDRAELMPTIVDLIGGLGGDGPKLSAEECMSFVGMVITLTLTLTLTLHPHPTPPPYPYP